MSESVGLAVRHTAAIVAAYAANHDVGDLPSVIRTVGQTIFGLGAEPVSAPAMKPAPAVPIKKSVFPDYIVCLEDGRRLKMLKRHLMSAFNLTPEQYRAKWGLAADYPMTAPNYTKKRSAIAKNMGLGTSAVSRPTKKRR